MSNAPSFSLIETHCPLLLENLFFNYHSTLRVAATAKAAAAPTELNCDVIRELPIRGTPISDNIVLIINSSP